MKVYVSLSLYIYVWISLIWCFLFVRFCMFMYRFDICYFMQESIETVVLEEHQSEVVVDPPFSPRQVHACFAFFRNIIFHPCSIYVSHSFYYMKLTYMLLYMQAPSEAPVHEEHQTGGPPLMSQHVCLCISLSLYICVSLSLIWCLKRPKLVTHLFPPPRYMYIC